MDIHPLGLRPEPEPIAFAPRVPRALLQALDGARELSAEEEPDGWQLYRDGIAIGRVSRPVDVPVTQMVPPARLLDEEPSLGLRAEIPSLG